MKDVNSNSKTVIITKANGDDSESAVVIGKKDWEAYQETMALLANGQLQFAMAHENDKDDVDIDDMMAEIDTEIANEKKNKS
ncbi:hypothetical protein IV59_GL000294 [Paucilactobacillus hokkaidonensis]|uniref:Prevent-host-death family protein n=1 Tax=Paucilactobacillus hokkaidonensis TaxID=1193095 RepID=A0ABR5Q521_9LACO|nr:hypothetical protein IV59_GL000294 [Paucilactobacillus hokkaidonensis]